MSSSPFTAANLKPVMIVLYSHIYKTSAPVFQINAGQDYAAFKNLLRREYPMEFDLLYRSGKKPKEICEMFPDCLEWISDSTVPGCGYIKSHKKKRTIMNKTDDVSNAMILRSSDDISNKHGFSDAIGQLTLNNNHGLTNLNLNNDMLKQFVQSKHLKMSISQTKEAFSNSIIEGSNQTMKVTQQVEFMIAPYGVHAGKTKFDKTIHRDKFNNVVGPEYDLSPDNAFKGQRIVILQLYSEASFTFAKPKLALERKGFIVDIYKYLPSVKEFTKILKKACQLWVISNRELSITVAYMPIIQKFVDLKKGLFIWGDNDPYNADANFILTNLTQTHSLLLGGNYYGCKILSEAEGEKGWEYPGFYNGKNLNLVFTGIESIYEGNTIATIQGPTSAYRSIMRASDGQVVTGVHDRNGVRILIDGGFTRLYETFWDQTAGTARFVTNAACWLYNFEGRYNKNKK